jgi:F5/8 type C domain
VGTAGAGTAGDQGTAGAGTAGAGTAGDQGTAGAGTAGDQGTAGAGTAGATVAVCNNSTVVSAGGTELKCGTKANWVATAMPTPASKLDGIMDTLLQPQYAIDGNTATRYSSGMTMAQGFYFEVDLGAAKMVSGITVDTSEGSDITDVADGYEVDLSTDGTTFTKIIGCTSPAAPMEVINFTATSARYIRYINEGPPSNGGTSWLSIHEFDILCN